MPDFPTTIPAATFDILTESLRLKPLAIDAARLAITVSPAPETSKTSCANVEKSVLIIVFFCFSTSVIPSAPLVIKSASNFKSSIRFFAFRVRSDSLEIPPTALENSK